MTTDIHLMNLRVGSKKAKLKKGVAGFVRSHCSVLGSNHLECQPMVKTGSGHTRAALPIGWGQGHFQCTKSTAPPLYLSRRYARGTRASELVDFVLGKSPRHTLYQCSPFTPVQIISPDLSGWAPGHNRGFSSPLAVVSETHHNKCFGSDYPLIKLIAIH